VCIDPHQTGPVCKDSDHIQLTKFWTSCVPGNGVCSGAKKFCSTLLQPVRSVCVSSEHFFFIFSVKIQVYYQCCMTLIAAWVGPLRVHRVCMISSTTDQARATKSGVPVDLGPGTLYFQGQKIKVTLGS